MRDKRALTLETTRASAHIAGFISAAMLMWLLTKAIAMPVYADNFTDIFYTNSFRGSFEWFSHFDWVGMVVQAVISIFALFGTALITIRIMTSMLYLSAKGMWEEVHDLKQSGGESEYYDLGFLNMAKSWAKGKGGYTGLDAIMGAVLTLLPDVKRYSDFGEKSGQKFDEDTTITQYMLKILLPTVLSIFFLAMAFNGTLMKGIAVSVDALGTIADHAVSVNYAGFIDDFINQKTGYKFMAKNDGTNKGKLLGDIQNQVYSRVVANLDNAGPAQLYALGQSIESAIDAGKLEAAIKGSTQIGPQVKGYISGESGGESGTLSDSMKDRYYSFIGATVYTGGAEAGDAEGSNGIITIPMSTIFEGASASGDVGIEGIGAEKGSYNNQYINIYLEQTKTFDGSYINTGDVNR